MIVLLLFENTHSEDTAKMLRDFVDRFCKPVHRAFCRSIEDAKKAQTRAVIDGDLRTSSYDH